MVNTNNTTTPTHRSAVTKDIGPNLDRRNLLGKLGFGMIASTSLAGAAALAAPQEPGPSPELLRLIEEHRSATVAFVPARDRHAKADEIVRAATPDQLPFNNRYWKVVKFNEGVETCARNADFSASFMGDTQEDAIADLPASRQKQIKAALRGAKKDAERIIRNIFDRFEEIKRSSGIEDAERDLEWTGNGERNALKKLCQYQCVSLKEIYVRAEYLSGVDGERLTADCIVALLPASRKGEA
jgi:hypothetical protein